jgi:hypothetical protein
MHGVILLFLLYFTQNANEIFKDISRNYISVIMLGQYALFAFSGYCNSKRLSVTATFLLFVVSLLSMGRSGIIVASLILIVHVLISVNENKYANQKVHLHRRVVLTIVLCALVSIMFSDVSNLHTNIETAINRIKNLDISANPRSEIILEYLNNIDTLWDFVLGINISEIPLFEQWGNNLHNSFLHLHADYGIGGVLLIIFCTMKQMLRLARNHEWYILIILFALFLRSFTDKVAFAGIYDPIYVYILFFSIKKRYDDTENVELFNEVSMTKNQKQF